MYFGDILRDGVGFAGPARLKFLARTFIVMFTVLMIHFTRSYSRQVSEIYTFAKRKDYKYRTTLSQFRDTQITRF